MEKEDCEQLLYSNCKEIIWVLRITNLEDSSTKFHQSFAIDSSGTLMTGASTLRLTSSHEIHARRLNSNNFDLKAIVIHWNRECNIFVLKVEGASDCKFGKFCDDGILDANKEVVNIGTQSRSVIGSFWKGKVSFPCRDVRIPTDRKTCADYVCDMNITPEYRVMGDLFSGMTKNQPHFHPSVPLIQIEGIYPSVESRGGPIFDIRGKIIGMSFADYGPYLIGIHVSVLKQVQQDLRAIVDDGSGPSMRGARD
ncbi:uncharacterized protein LOC126654669 [Mercurialis annua]|uniref:uncharacterized protein LOC126654669 n=1 Tax=Mercurialis annua TaxID=3986 RepID=UPI002160B012|nr:uncharacterized protein LOC126654669 [Mercurialis annua]